MPSLVPRTGKNLIKNLRNCMLSCCSSTPLLLFLSSLMELLLPPEEMDLREHEQEREVVEYEAKGSLRNVEQFIAGMKDEAEGDEV